jgi:hypothetical protein
MTEDKDQTNSPQPEFDFSAHPRNSLYHDRRGGRDRRDQNAPAETDSTRPTSQRGGERRLKSERRRRIDPTTFEKQYTENEMEFMTAMQRFKELSGTNFPTHGEVLKVAIALGYRKAVVDTEPLGADSQAEDPSPGFVPTADR